MIGGASVLRGGSIVRPFLAILVISWACIAGQIGSDGGRYVFGQVSTIREDQFLLDTKTGRLWHLSMSGDSSLVLVPIPFRSARIDMVVYPDSAAMVEDGFKELVRVSKEPKK
jgi:hypothetical protein